MVHIFSQDLCLSLVSSAWRAAESQGIGARLCGMAASPPQRSSVLRSFGNTVSEVRCHPAPVEKIPEKKMDCYSDVAETSLNSCSQAGVVVPDWLLPPQHTHPHPPTPLFPLIRGLMPSDLSRLCSDLTHILGT